MLMVTSNKKTKSKAPQAPRETDVSKRPLTATTREDAEKEGSCKLLGGDANW